MLVLQNARHFKKFTGSFSHLTEADFDKVRDPLYKYSKVAKERLLRDEVYACLYLIFFKYYRNLIQPDEVPSKSGDFFSQEIIDDLCQGFKNIAENTIAASPFAWDLLSRDLTI